MSDYIQNSEQNSDSIWNRINTGNEVRARVKDEMIVLYGSNILSTLVVDKDADPELWKFIEDNKSKPHFSNYTTAKLQDFLSRIYELRKDNGNNTTR